MPYTISGSFDGACRLNGTPSAYGGAGVYFPRQPRLSATKALPNNSYPRVTNQRAELTGLVMILEAGLKRKMELDERNPFFILHVQTDSAYAIGCVTQWNEKWERNGWLNSKGAPVANRDLIEEALRLIEEIGQHGKVVMEKIGREDNEEADRLANQACDEARLINSNSNSDSDSDSDYYY